MKQCTAQCTSDFTPHSPVFKTTIPDYFTYGKHKLFHISEVLELQRSEIPPIDS